jgi:antitoxin CcdA
MPDRPQSKSRKATNVSINEAVLADAKALNIKMSRAAEAGIAEAVRAEKNRQWLEENREAIESSNAYVEQHGLPRARYRLF